MSIIGESILLSTIIENVLGKVGAPVLEEVGLTWDLERDLHMLKENLSAIKAMLLDAEEKQAHAFELKIWLEELKNLCYEVEDVLDELEYEGLRKQVVKQYRSSKTKVCRFFLSSNPLVFRFKIGHKIKELRESLDDIVAQKSKFHLIDLGRPVMEHRVREMTDSFVRMSNVVRRGVDKDKITELLLRDGSLAVIPIVGFGGMGKTTFAKMLYNDDTINGHFELKIWLCVSINGFDKKKLMVMMMNFFTGENLSDYEPERMETFIRHKLNGKRFLLILDDVWSNNRREWVDLVDLFKEGGSGSKVIVTTRSNKVAETFCTTPPYNLKPLSDEDSLSLFKKLAFREGEEEIYPNLVEIGNDIVQKNRRVPLAIGTLGTLLYAKRDEQDWVSIRDSEIWKLEQSKGDILPVLKLSYDQLPPHLKSCFTICSTFPENFVFDNLQLTRIWMAHGLLQSPDGNEEPEDIGLRYVKELCSKSFFQDIEEFDFAWRFKMHDLVYDLAMSVAHNECSVVKRQDVTISEGTRHLSLLGVKDFLDIKVPNSLRTINFMPYGDESPSVLKSVVDKCISTCRRLRVLIVWGSFDVLPSSIGGLKHLRYLQLGFNRIKKLPHSLWKLHNLQTLDIIGCVQLEELPRDIRKLIKLRVLRFTTKQRRLPEDGIRTLNYLRSLTVWKCALLEVLFEGNTDTTSLRSLIIGSCANLSSLGLSLNCVATLETLVITNSARLNLMEWDDIGDIEFKLQYLLLGGLPQLTTLPPWLQGSSKTLQYMHIWNCENLSSLPEWLSNFKSLRKFKIINCPKLLTLPEGMRHLTALESLVIEDCLALTKRFKRHTGVDWHKIAHIPIIKIT